MTVFHMVLDGEAIDLSDIDIKDCGASEVPSFHIFSSSLLTGKEEEEFIAELKQKISKMVDHYVQEKRYTVRLLLSSLVFLIVYFIGTLAVRDPFPILDEIIIALAASVIFWRYMKNRDTRQIMALDYKKRLLKAVDNALEEESPLLGHLESLYADLKKFSPVELTDKIVSGLDSFLIPSGEEDMYPLFTRLFSSYIAKEEKALFSDMQDLKKGGYDSRSMKNRLLKAYGTGRYDIYLLAFYLSL